MDTTEVPALPLLELLSLVERRLESARLPCAKLLYGGLSDPIRTPTGISRYMTAAESPRALSAEAPTR